MTARQNIRTSLAKQRLDRQETDRRIAEASSIIGIDAQLDKLPSQLSGGERQRVATAKAIVRQPRAFLLDEPLAALDLKLRKAMQAELRRIHHSIGGTFVFVTHDQSEAMGLASHIAVMSEGRIVQQGSAEEIYATPESRFVSTFIGEANILHGQRENGHVRLALGMEFDDAGADENVVVMLRPEAVTLALAGEGGTAGRHQLAGRLEDAVFLGTYVKYTVEVGDETFIAHSADTELRDQVAIGSDVVLTWASDDHKVLPDT